jgi:hypothetical protein
LHANPRAVASPRDNHGSCRFSLHAKGNHYQSIKIKIKRNYFHQKVMIFLACKTTEVVDFPSMQTNVRWLPRATIMVVVDFPCMQKEALPRATIHHVSCDLIFLHAKGNYYQSIKLNRKRNYFHQEVMIFLSCKITEHDYLPRCGGGRSAG